MNTQEAGEKVQCACLGGLCQARGPHTQHWWSSEQVIRDAGLTRATDGSVQLVREVSQ